MSLFKTPSGREFLIVVMPVPAAPGYYAYTRDHEERHSTAWGSTPEEAEERHKAWILFKEGEET